MVPNTERTIRLFLARVRERYDVADVLLFGSRARHQAGSDSNANVLILLCGDAGRRIDAALDMAGSAFDVMLETGYRRCSHWTNWTNRTNAR